MGRGVEGLLKVERRERNLKEWNKGQSLYIKIYLFLAFFVSWQVEGERGK